MQLTEHFSFEELTDSSKFPNLVEQNRLDAMNPILLKHLKYIAGTLEEIRVVLGCKIAISSGYRNDALNKAVGGSTTSTHKQGITADIVPYIGTVEEAFEKLLANRDKLPSMRKCIIEGIKGKVWLHIQAKVETKEKQEFFKTNDGINYIKVG